MKRLIAALTLLSLAACTGGPTRYAPAADADAVGYREQRLEQDRYRVSFRANPDLRGPQVEDMALRRAAELTVQNGYQWFNVVSRYTDLAGGSYSPTGPTVGIGGSSGSFGSGIGVGLGFNFGGDSRQFESTLEILMGRGAKPADPNTYDAQQVLNRPM
jgi:predicted small lipoprotein YifL